MTTEKGITWQWLTGILVTIILLLVGGWAASIRSSDAQLTTRLEELDKTKAAKVDLAGAKVEISLVDVKVLALDAKKADRTEVGEINRRLITIETDIKELLRRK